MTVALAAAVLAWATGCRTAPQAELTLGVLASTVPLAEAVDREGLAGPQPVACTGDLARGAAHTVTHYEWARLEALTADSASGIARAERIIARTDVGSPVERTVTLPDGRPVRLRIVVVAEGCCGLRLSGLTVEDTSASGDGRLGPIACDPPPHRLLVAELGPAEPGGRWLWVMAHAIVVPANEVSSEPED